MNRLLDINVLPNSRFAPILINATEQCILCLHDADTSATLIATIKDCVSLMFDNLLTHGSSAREYEVRLCISTDENRFIIEMKDTGLPGDLSVTDEGLQLAALGCCYENINQFQHGRCQKAVFTFPESIDDISPDNTDDDTPITGAQISIRETDERDYTEIGRAYYKEMGFTYPLNVYDPSFLQAFLKKDNIHALTAVTEDDTFAGFHTVRELDILPGVYEGGMAITNSRVRKCGAFSRLMDANNDYFDNVVKHGVQISDASTQHEITQKTRLKYGFTPCGFNFNVIPVGGYTTTFMNNIIGRSSGALSCHVIDHNPKTVYVPEEIIPVLSKVYSGESLPRTYVTDMSEPDEEKTLHYIYAEPGADFAEAVIRKTGKDHRDVLRNYVHLAKSQMQEVLVLYISIDHPGTAALYEEAKEKGFFFESVIPCTGYGDIIMMVNPLNSLINYDQIVTYGSFTDMLEMIRKFDPNETH